jgi:hypothetical protein
MLPSGAARPSATSHDKINGTQSLQHRFSACKLSVYALQWLLPGTAQDSIIDVFGSTLSMQSLSDASYFTLRGTPRLSFVFLGSSKKIYDV